MNPLQSIQTALPTFTKKEKLIAEAILKDPVSVVQVTAQDLAEKVSSSKSAYIRMCQKMGFEGYSDFRFSISRHLLSAGSKSDEENPMQAILNSYSEYILNIASTIKKEDVHTLASYILTATRVKLFGINRTGLSAKQLRMRLIKLGLDAEAVNDSVTMRDLSSLLTKEDVCIIFSIKGLPDYYQYAKDLRERGCKVVLLTMTPKTPMRKDVDLLLQLPYISRSSNESFLDDQAIFFVFIEVLLNEVARMIG